MENAEDSRRGITCLAQGLMERGDFRFPAREKCRNISIFRLGNLLCESGVEWHAPYCRSGPVASPAISLSNKPRDRRHQTKSRLNLPDVTALRISGCPCPQPPCACSCLRSRAAALHCEPTANTPHRRRLPRTTPLPQTAGGAFRRGRY